MHFILFSCYNSLVHGDDQKHFTEVIEIVSSQIKYQKILPCSMLCYRTNGFPMSESISIKLKEVMCY